MAQKDTVEYLDNTKQTSEKHLDREYAAEENGIRASDSSSIDIGSADEQIFSIVDPVLDAKMRLINKVCYIPVLSTRSYIVDNDSADDG